MDSPLNDDDLDALFAEVSAGDPNQGHGYRMTLEKHRDCIFLVFEGNCMEAAPADFEYRMQSVFEAEQTKRAVVDLRQCHYISSAAIGVIVSFFKASTNQGGQVLLLQPPEKVVKVIKLVGLDELFLIVDSEEMAIQYYLAQGI